MSKQDLDVLVSYRLQRATDALIEARLMEGEAHWNACANRLYYAAFYAVSALLLLDGHQVSKHSGIKALFNQHYIKSAIFTLESGRFYNRLFDLRQEGDYFDLVFFDAETIAPLVDETDAFIKRVQSYITIQQQ